MRRRLSILALLCGISGHAMALSEPEARHLLVRAGEVVSQENLAALRFLDRDEAFSWLERNHAAVAARPEERFPWFDAYDEFYRHYTAYADDKRSLRCRKALGLAALRLKGAMKLKERAETPLRFNPRDTGTFDVDVYQLLDIAGHLLSISLIQEVIHSESRFTTTMTLFWHGHFTSSFAKVLRPDLMLRQHVLLRRLSLGNFGQLLHEITYDPAMLIYLDGNTSTAGEPNLNFARELFELFTLGEGNYAERDISEAARALTGLAIVAGKGLLDRTRHDSGVKTVLGSSGALTPDTLLDLLLSKPATSRRVVTKLWRAFVSPDPDPTLVFSWAEEFRRSGFDIRQLMRRILTSDAFYADANRLTLIKSPLEVVFFPYITFNYEPQDPLDLVLQTSIMGQQLYQPPDVSGWRTGTDMITPSTWLMRQHYMQRIFRADPKRYPNALGADRAARWLSSLSPKGRAQAVFFITGTQTAILDQTGSDLEFLGRLTTSPGFNLK